MNAAPRSLSFGVPLLVAVAFLVASIPFLPEFGPTWDTAIGEFAHGEQYLAYLTSGDERMLDFTDAGARPAHRAPHPAFDRGLNGWKDAFPLGGIVSAISCRMLWTKLGVLDAMSAHDLPILVFAAILLFAMTRFALPRFGALAAIGAVALLLSSPRFLSDQFFNVKDAPETCLYALVLLVFFRALETSGAASLRAMASAGALTGLALAQKVNGLLLPAHGLLLFVALAIARRARGERGPAFPWIGVLVAIPIALVVFFAVSPMTWSDPFGRAIEHFRYYTGLGFRHWIPRFPGALAFVTTTPLPLLVLAPLGLFSRRARIDERLLLACGALVPIVRVSLPWADNFDGVRHFLEFYPFLALLAALALATLADGITRALSGRRAIAVAFACVVAIAPGAAGVVRTWPYGTVWFNVSIGGLSGAQSRGILDATDYWASSYWEALDRVRREAPPGSSLLVPVAPHVARAAAPVRLLERLGDDVWFDPSRAIPAERKRPIVAFFITRSLVESEIVTWLEAHATKWFEIRRDGGVLLKAFRVDDPARIEELKAVDAKRFQLGVAVDRVFRQLAKLPEPQVERWSALLRTKSPTDLATVEAEMRAALPDALREELDVLFPALPELMERMEAKPAGR